VLLTSKLNNDRTDSETITGNCGYPLYRRRPTADNGRSTIVKVNQQDIEIDNRWIVPYSPILLNTFNAHINDESCQPVYIPVSVAIYTKFQKFPFNSSWNVRVLHNVPLILITSPANILNSPINSFCPLVTALLIISIEYSPLLPYPLPIGSFSKLHVAASLLFIHMNVFSTD
jgi:hypothetical protein